ncbi:MAG: class F sortase [Flexilinea sp.]
MKKSILFKLVLTLFIMFCVTTPVFADEPIEPEILSASYYETGFDGEIQLKISNPNGVPVPLSLPEVLNFTLPSGTATITWDVASPYDLPASPADIPNFTGTFIFADQTLAANNASLPILFTVNGVDVSGAAFRTGEFVAISNASQYVFGIFPQCLAKGEFFFVYQNIATSKIDFTEVGLNIDTAYDAATIGPIQYAVINGDSLDTDTGFLAAVESAEWTDVPVSGFESSVPGFYVFRIYASDFSRFAGVTPEPTVNLSFTLGTTLIEITGLLHFDAVNTENCNYGKIISATYNIDGLDGKIQLEINNFSTETQSIDLPSILQYTGNSQAKLANITWSSPGSPVSLGSGEKIIAYGAFTVDPVIAGDNDSLPISLTVNNMPVEGTAVKSGYVVPGGQCFTGETGETGFSLDFSLTNLYNNGQVIVELPSDVRVINQDGAYPLLTYTACTNNENTDCMSRIQSCGAYQCIYITQDETITLRASATAHSPLTESNLQFKTSLRYSPGSEITEASPAVSLGWISEICDSAAASSLEVTADSSEYDTCDTDDGIIHLNYTLTNVGTASQTIDFTNVYYFRDTVTYTYNNQVTNLTCTLSNASVCTPDSAVIPAGESVTITAELDTGSRILTTTYGFSGRSLTDTNLLIDPLTATQINNYCEAALTFDNVTGTFTLRGTSANASLIITNNGTLDAWFVPMNFLFHSTTAAYTGEVNIGETSKAVTSLNQGQRYPLSPRESAVISAILSANSSLTNGEVAWSFLTGTGTQNITGTLTTTNPTPSQNDGGFPPDYYDNWGGRGQRPEKLPGTGFPSGKRTILPLQPAALAYMDLGGYSLEIPVIDSYAEIVTIPQNDDNSFAVDWLSDRAGLLEGSALPGQGTAVIAGHNHIDTGNAGPFAFLVYLTENDRIFVRTAENLIQKYSVYANELVEPDNVDTVYDTAIPGSLVLITCEQELTEGGYKFRRIVYAKPI